MEVKSKTGFAIVEVRGKGGYASFVCPNTDPVTGKVDGISGYIYIYATKKAAQEHAVQLEVLWSDGTKFKVVKVKVSRA